MQYIHQLQRWRRGEGPTRAGLGRPRPHVRKLARTRTATHTQPRTPRSHARPHAQTRPPGRGRREAGITSPRPPLCNNQGRYHQRGQGRGTSAASLWQRRARWSRIPSSLSSFSVFGLQDPLVTEESRPDGRRRGEKKRGRLSWGAAREGRGNGRGRGWRARSLRMPGSAPRSASGRGPVREPLGIPGPLQDSQEHVAKGRIKTLRRAPGPVISIPNCCWWGLYYYYLNPVCSHLSWPGRGACRRPRALGHDGATGPTCGGTAANV